MCEVLLKIGLLLDRNAYTRTAKQMFQAVGPRMVENPEKHVSWSRPLLNLKKGLTLLVVSGEDPQALSQDVDRLFHPGIIFSAQFPFAGSGQGRPRGNKPFYLCRFGDCGEGFSTAEEVWTSLER